MCGGPEIGALLNGTEVVMTAPLREAAVAF